MTEQTDLSPKALRHILGHFAAGLTVITAATQHGPAGFTAEQPCPATGAHWLDGWVVFGNTHP
ncbi:hypothetical protein [Arthrobacter sp. 9MFCol3.1]|uniref:hypothetical protein n=1 Tax=Arthrobacter sp. 9MFCol3.1 TaxID=1150398 RepID=UPI00047CFC78|nr:hypothetical protein [Arthrobacter sp. 9MFCol3.1]